MSAKTSRRYTEMQEAGDRPRDCRCECTGADDLLSRPRRKSRHGFKIPEILIIAHIQPAGITDGLEVPRRIASDAQCFVDEMTAPLACDHRRVKSREIPALGYFCAKLPQPR